MSQKVVGDRTCVGCRCKAPKAELARVVRDRRGVVVVDPLAPGRGAYVHRRHECVTKALRTEAFARSFRQRIFIDPRESDRFWSALGVDSAAETTKDRGKLEHDYG